MPDPWRDAAYTASDNAQHGRGSGHARQTQSTVGLATVGVINVLLGSSIYVAM